METTEGTEHEWYTVDEIASKYRVSKMTIYRVIKTGELPSIQVGRCFRVSHAALVGYIERNGRKIT